MFTSVTFAQQNIKVDFNWKPSNGCNIKAPSISVVNIPTGSTSLIISLVDINNSGLDHGKSFIKSKTVFPETMKLDISLKTLGIKCPPNFLEFGNTYEITVIAKDINSNILGKGLAISLFPKNAITDPLFTELFDEAKKLIKLRVNVKFPEIYPTTVEHLKSLVCQETINCPISAVYYKNTIYYKHDLILIDHLTKSRFVHDFIHHIQANRGSLATDCNIWYKNEIEAYKFQARYLRNNNQDDSFISNALKIIKCP